jgi:hypothetical protein
MPRNSTNQRVKRKGEKKKSLNMNDIVLAFAAGHKLSLHRQTRPKVRLCSAVWSKDGPRQIQDLPALSDSPNNT